jgi:hypothetical protein
MQTLEMPSSEIPASPAGQGNIGKTAAWLFRRTLLWAFLVALGVASACLLYTAVNSAEADSDSRAPAAIAAARP